MSVLELVNWEHISFTELDTLLRVGSYSNGAISIDKELSTGLTPLCVACKHNREDLVSVLLHHGASVDHPSTYLAKRPLHYACDHAHRNLGIVRKLLEAGAWVDAQDDDGNTGLHLACTETNQAVVKLLVEHTANVNLLDIDGESPLVRACYASSVELVQFLLGCGADPNASKELMLDVAVQRFSVDVVKLLIDSGADVHSGAYMCHAAKMEDIEMMKLFHKYNVDLNKANCLGFAPVHMACLNPQDSTALRLLLHWGARPDTPSFTNETALHMVCRSLDLNKIHLLLAYGAKLTSMISPTDQLPSLMQALQLNVDSSKVFSQKRIKVVRLLFGAGAVVTPDMLESFSSAVSILDDDGDDKEVLWNLFTTHAFKPMSLQDLCRVKIRHCVGPQVDDNLCSLPLPTQIIRYLSCFDIMES